MKQQQNALLQDWQQIGNIGLPINNQPTYVPTAAFPNTTTLYGWRNGQPVQGGIALTKNGTIGQAVDHAGNLTECDFTGNGYYSSADAAFAFTGSFSVGFWMYRKDWAKSEATSQTVLSRATAGSGWAIQQASSTLLGLYANSALVSLFDVAHLASGFHFFSFVRNSSTTQTICLIDGVRISTINSVGTITASGSLEIGSIVSGTQKIINARLSDIYIHNGTAWTDAQVKAIYQATCPNASYNQKFAGHRLQLVEPNQTAEECLAFYQFNNPVSLSIDTKGNYPLTAVGTTAQGEDIFGNMGALRLQGGGAAYYNANLLSVAPSKGIWISLWVKPELYDSTDQYILGRLYSTGHIIGLYKSSINTYVVNYGSGTAKALPCMTPVRVGREEKIDLCWDTTNGFRFFVNGVLEASDPTATTLPTFNTTYPFQIGRYFNGSGSMYFTGSICDFKVLDKIPTQNDIDIAYSSTFSKPSVLNGCEMVIRPNGDSARERREKIAIVGRDSALAYRQGMRQFYYDVSNINLKQNHFDAYVDNSTLKQTYGDCPVLKSIEAPQVYYTRINYKDGMFSVVPAISAINNGNGNPTNVNIYDKGNTSWCQFIHWLNGSGASIPLKVSLDKIGPDFIPDGMVVTNNGDIVQVRTAS